MTDHDLSKRLFVTGRRVALGAAAAVILAVAPALATPALSDTAVTSRNERIVRDAFQRWAAGENVFPLLVAPDVVWTIPGSGPIAGTYRGLQDLIERGARPLVSRLAGPIVPQVHHIWATGDWVIVRFDGTAPTTAGQTYRNQFVWIFRMKDGLAVEAEAFLDLVAYQQVVDNNTPRRP